MQNDVTRKVPNDPNEVFNSYIARIYRRNFSALDKRN